MSYLRKIEYEIILKESFSVIRNCAGCGRKTRFQNTKKFRINANGSKLDVWLIYQCEKCRHTLNLAIYERQKASSIPKAEYQRFLGNDEQFAEMYGKTVQLFRKNKAEIDFEQLPYDIVKLHESTEHSDSTERILLQIHNSYELKIRPEKQIAEILGLSRSQVQKMMQQGEMEPENISPQLISVYISSSIWEYAISDRSFPEK